MSDGILKKLLFPPAPRGFPGRRVLRSCLRSIHILGGGVLVGAYLFHQGPEAIQAWTAVAVLSGISLLLTDLHATFAVLLEVRGLAVLSKLVMLAAVPLLPGFEVVLLTGILVVGTVSSHLSRRFRHKLWLPVANVTSDERHG